MRILVVHNRYLLRGGEDSVQELECELLARRGHQVELFLESNERVEEIGRLAAAVRTVWSQESYRKIRALLRGGRFDVVHVHNSFPLISPSVFYAARAEGVPVVQTLHNYRLACLNYSFSREGRVCEDCLGKAVPWPGVLHRCYKDSRAGSLTVAAMLTTHRALGTWQRKVDGYIALTEFARRKLIETGLPEGRVWVKPNFVDPDPGASSRRREYMLFVGRLSPEKGVATILRAWDALPRPVPLKIVGSGPLEGLVRATAAARAHIEFLGPRSPDEVVHLMGGAAAVLFPSEWYETFGRVAIEAQATATPVIASDIGAIAELVEHGQTGLLFPPGDAAALADAAEQLWSRPDEVARLGQRARQEFEAKYTAERNYQLLTDIYRRAIATAGRSPAAVPVPAAEA